MTIDYESLRSFSVLGMVLVFLGGLLTSLGPCNVATIPLIVGFVGGSHDLPRRRAFTISLAFAIGLAITFMALGLIAALIGGVIGANTRRWYYLVAGICFVIGLHMLGVLNLSFPMLFASLRDKVGLKGVSGALALGLISGLVASQCATPVLAAILTYVMAKGAMFYGAVLLFVYALGRGVPVVLAGTFTGALKNFQKLGHWNDLIEKASGVIILAVGFYFLWIA
jgi:cytochrome c-type biogenesis protein